MLPCCHAACSTNAWQSCCRVTQPIVVPTTCLRAAALHLQAAAAERFFPETHSNAAPAELFDTYLARFRKCCATWQKYMRTACPEARLELRRHLAGFNSYVPTAQLRTLWRNDMVGERRVVEAGVATTKPLVGVSQLLGIAVKVRDGRAAGLAAPCMLASSAPAARGAHHAQDHAGFCKLYGVDLVSAAGEALWHSFVADGLHVATLQKLSCEMHEVCTCTA